MKITRNTTETGRGPSDWFTGAVYVDTLAAPANGSRISGSSVHTIMSHFAGAMSSASSEGPSAEPATKETRWASWS